jgi:hypothetical protein
LDGPALPPDIRIPREFRAPDHIGRRLDSWEEMRWDFLLFFASLAVTTLGGEWGAYIGVAGMAVFGAHGILSAIQNNKVRTMVMVAGLIASGSVFIALAAFYAKPTWFGLSEMPKSASIPPETERLVSQAQFAKVAELEKFLGNKDENDLRVTFDLPNILQKNIDTQIERMKFIKSGRESDFYYNNYSDNGTFIFWVKDGHFTKGPSGVHIEAGPQDVLFLVTTTKYQNAQKRLVEFMNSALIPESIKKEVRAFNDVLQHDTELMMKVLDKRMHEDENYFWRNMDMKSQYYGVIVTEFADSMTHLQPAGKKVIDAIAGSWKISK